MRKIFGVVIGILVITVILPFLFDLFGITGLKMPFMLYYVLNDGLGSLLSKLYFFLPVNFILACLFLIFTIKHLDTLINIVVFIYKSVVDS